MTPMSAKAEYNQKQLEEPYSYASTISAKDGDAEFYPMSTPVMLTAVSSLSSSTTTNPAPHLIVEEKPANPISAPNHHARDKDGEIQYILAPLVGPGSRKDMPDAFAFYNLLGRQVAGLKIPSALCISTLVSSNLQGDTAEPGISLTSDDTSKRKNKNNAASACLAEMLKLSKVLFRSEHAQHSSTTISDPSCAKDADPRRFVLSLANQQHSVKNLRRFSSFGCSSSSPDSTVDFDKMFAYNKRKEQLGLPSQERTICRVSESKKHRRRPIKKVRTSAFAAFDESASGGVLGAEILLPIDEYESFRWSSSRLRLSHNSTADKRATKASSSHHYETTNDGTGGDKVVATR